MSKKKGLLGVFVAIALLAAQVSVVAAAPQSDPLVGTIDSISQGTDSGGNTVIIVSYTDTDGNSQTQTLTLQQAADAGLVTLDANGALVSIDAAAGGTIDLTTVLAEVDPCAPAADAGGTSTGDTGGTLTTTGSEDTTGGSTQPVAEGLCGYFNGSLGVTYDQIMGWHEDGFGFGVIAQALFMAELGDLDPQAILDAKKSGDYSSLGFEGVENWGRLRQELLGKGVDKATHNLGAIMSGRITPVVTDTPTSEPTTSATLLTTSQTLHGKSGLHGKGGGHGKGHNK